MEGSVWMSKLAKILSFVSSIADTQENTKEERLQHSFLIYMGVLMSIGGVAWGTISFLSGMQAESSIPYAYALITLMNFFYLYHSKNFKVAQSIQILISLLLPFLFQFVLGGFFASGGVIWWSILSILAGFAFQNRQTTFKWFLLYLVLVIMSAVLDGRVIEVDKEIPRHLSLVFFGLNITLISIIIYTLFYYFADSESKNRHFLELSELKLKDALAENRDYLRVTQNQLIESEKMSALGNLVAGVAHEVNTPLGISITAASVFAHEIKNIRELIDNDKLTKSDLGRFLDTFDEADTILEKNLGRAVSLIKNFKQISVDQCSELIRDFELNEYIEEIISTFRSEFKHRPVELTLKLSPEKINMHSNPGSLSQVIVNMLQNTLFHGFDMDQEGELVIETVPKEDHVVIRVSDNGKGVSKELADKIFEPFITSKRNEGGTGLGLSITHTLVTKILGGKIRLDKEHTQGASFIIHIPYKVRENEEKD